MSRTIRWGGVNGQMQAAELSIIDGSTHAVLLTNHAQTMQEIRSDEQSNDGASKFGKMETITRSVKFKASVFANQRAAKLIEAFELN
jgi:hypothetical protein